MKYMSTAAMVALLFLLTLGASSASASLLYCTSSSCSTTQPVSGAYWTADPTIALDTTNHTFDFSLTITANNSAGGYMQDFSGQYFFGGGASVSTLAWVLNPGGWAGPWASKAGNSGSCQGSANGAFCAAQSWNFGPTDKGAQGSFVALSSTPVIFELTGSYSGTFLDPNGNYHLQMAASVNADGTGGNAFAISQDFPGTVPDGGTTLVLLGGALAAVETVRRRVRA